MENRIAAYVLQYLLEHRFSSKADMARQFGIHPRTLDRTFENLEEAKSGAVAFHRAIEYCAKHRISLDAIFEKFAEEFEPQEDMRMDDKQAYHRLKVTIPENLSDEGNEVFASMLRFLQKASLKLCPHCETWCNPWDGKRCAEEMDCCIGHMAREIAKDTAEFYTKEGATE